MMKCIYLFCVFVVTLPLLTVDQVDTSYEGQQISVKGFLLSSDEGKWYITSTRDIKSCCLEKASMKTLYIESNEKIEPTNRVVTVRGIVQNKPRLALVEACFIKNEVPFFNLTLALGTIFMGCLALHRHKSGRWFFCSFL